MDQSELGELRQAIETISRSIVYTKSVTTEELAQRSFELLVAKGELEEAKGELEEAKQRIEELSRLKEELSRLRSEAHPDAEQDRVCIRCKQSFGPDQGVMVYPDPTGPLTFLRSLSVQLADDETAKRFVCHRCETTRHRIRVVKMAAFYAFSVACAAFVLWLLFGM